MQAPTPALTPACPRIARAAVQVICGLLLAARTSLPAVFTPDAAVIQQVSLVRLQRQGGAAGSCAAPLAAAWVACCHRLHTPLVQFPCRAAPPLLSPAGAAPDCHVHAPGCRRLCHGWRAAGVAGGGLAGQDGELQQQQGSAHLARPAHRRLRGAATTPLCGSIRTATCMQRAGPGVPCRACSRVLRWLTGAPPLPSHYRGPPNDRWW